MGASIPRRVMRFKETGGRELKPAGEFSWEVAICEHGNRILGA